MKFLKRAIDANCAAMKKISQNKLFSKSLMVVLLLCLALSIFDNRVYAEKAKFESDSLQLQNNEAKKTGEPPIIIWHFHLIRDDLDSLKTALSSGLINHVSVGGTLNRRDFDWTQSGKLAKAMEILKEANVKIIWTRLLWPVNSAYDVTDQSLYDPNYYIEEIENLKKEKILIGADFALIDVEAYGYAPAKKVFTGGDKLNDEQLAKLKIAIDAAILKTGKVDFVLPAGLRMRPRHAYNFLSVLGQNRICEDTYWNVEHRIKTVGFDYEIFGAIVSTTEKNEKNPAMRYFTVETIFENSQFWSDKKGLFIFPKVNNASAVAEEMVKFSRSLPIKDDH